MSSDAGGIRAGRAFVELLLAGEEKFRQGLERAEHRLKQLGRAVSEIGRTVAAGGALLTAPFALALKIFDQAGQHIRQFQREAAVAGVGIDPQDLRAAWDFAQALKTLTASVKVLAIQVASALAPALQETFAWVTRMVHGVGLWARANPAVIQQLAKIAVGVTAAGVALVGLGHAMRTTSAVLKLLTFGMGAAQALLAGGMAAALGVAQALWFGAGLAVSAFHAALSVGQAVLGLHTLAAWAATGATVALKAAWGFAALVGWTLNAAGAAAAAMFVGYSAAAWVANVATNALSLAGAVLEAVLSGGLTLLVPLAVGVLALAAALGAAAVAAWYFASAGAGLITWIGGAFTAAVGMAGATLGRLKEIFGETWGAIQKAMEAGDLAGAAEAAWAGVKYAVLSNTVGIQKAWVNFTTDVQEVWAELTAYLATTWIDVQGTVEEGLVFLRHVWEALGDAVEAVVSTIQGAFQALFAVLTPWVQRFAIGFAAALTTAVATVAAKLYPLLQAAIALGTKVSAAVLGEVQHLAGVTPQQAEAEAKAQVGQHRKTYGDKWDEEAQERQVQRDERKQQIDDDRDDKIAALERRRQERLKDVDKGVADAKKQWEDKVAEARNKADGADTAPNPLALKSDVHGTFNAAAVGALGSTKINEMTDLLRDGNRKLDRINNTLQKTGKTT